MAEAQNFVDFEDEGAGFVLIEFAFGILEFGEGSAGAGTGVAIFLELEGFAAGAGEGVEEAGKGSGIAAEMIVE